MNHCSKIEDSVQDKNLTQTILGFSYFRFYTFLVRTLKMTEQTENDLGIQIGSYLSFLCVDFPIDGFVFRHFNSACSSLDLKCLKTMPSIGKPTHKKDK